MVRNLVSNAVKLTEHGTVTLRVEPQADRILIEIIDTGIGIATDQLPMIFDMFRQVDSAPTRRRGGVRPGLYIVTQFGAASSASRALPAARGMTAACLR